MLKAGALFKNSLINTCGVWLKTTMMRDLVAQVCLTKMIHVNVFRWDLIRKFGQWKCGQQRLSSCWCKCNWWAASTRARGNGRTLLKWMRMKPDVNISVIMKAQRSLLMRMWIPMASNLLFCEMWTQYCNYVSCELTYIYFLDILDSHENGTHMVHVVLGAWSRAHSALSQASIVIIVFYFLRWTEKQSAKTADYWTIQFNVEAHVKITCHLYHSQLHI